MKHPAPLFTALALAFITAHAADLDWPQFRGPTGQGFSDATGVPTEWSDTQRGRNTCVKSRAEFSS